jgi:hypothetical protein
MREIRNTCTNLVRILEGKRLVGRPKHNFYINFKMSRKYGVMGLDSTGSGYGSMAGFY